MSARGGLGPHYLSQKTPQKPSTNANGSNPGPRSIRKRLLSSLAASPILKPFLQRKNRLKGELAVLTKENEEFMAKILELQGRLDSKLLSNRELMEVNEELEEAREELKAANSTLQQRLTNAQSELQRTGDGEAGKLVRERESLQRTKDEALTKVEALEDAIDVLRSERKEARRAQDTLEAENKELRTRCEELLVLLDAARKRQVEQKAMYAHKDEEQTKKLIDVYATLKKLYKHYEEVRGQLKEAKFSKEAAEDDIRE